MTEAELRELGIQVTRLLEERGARREGDELRFRCPKPDHHANGDARWSARWHPEKGVWRCDVSGEGGGTLNLRWLLHMEGGAQGNGPRNPPTPRRHAQRPGKAPRTQARVVQETIYAVRDAAGSLVGEHVRRDLDTGEKVFTWRRNGQPGLGGLKVADLPLYGAHELAAIGPRTTIVLVEGEKTRDALAQRGVCAVGTVTGASGTPSDEVLRELAGYDVVLWTDADVPGRRHMRRISARLAALEIPHRLVDPWPHRTEGRDAADWSGTPEDLRAMLADAPLACAGASWVRLADVEPETVEWLWPGRIPLGKVTLLEGDPDEGKSCVAIDLAARVTRGLAMPMPNTCDPDPARDPAGVVYVTAEDGLADTIRPRLDAAEGDPGRVLAFSLEALPQIDEAGLQTIENAIRACDARLVVLDPLNAFLSERVDTYKDHHIRRALAPLAALAARTGVAVLVIRHLNKSGGQNAKYRGGGSIGIFGAARSALLAAPDPDDPSRKVLALNKHNLSGDVPALGYELLQVDLPAPGDKPITTVRVRWLGPTRYTPQDLLAEQAGEEDRSALDEAMEAIRAIVAKGPVLVKDARATLRAAGVSDRTADRARTRLGVRARPTGYRGAWEWHPPVLLPLGKLLEALANAIAAWVAAPRSSLWRDGETGGTGETDPQEPLVDSQSRQAAQSRQGLTGDEVGESGDSPVPDEEWLP